MAHFAQVIDGVVVQVIVAEQDFIDNYADKNGNWIQTSYNTRGGVYYQPNSNVPAQDQSKALRKNYAGIGSTYDEVLDVFIPPKPFESWVLNTESFLWEPPVPVPDYEHGYLWNEDIKNWELIEEVLNDA